MRSSCQRVATIGFVMIATLVLSVGCGNGRHRLGVLEEEQKSVNGFGNGSSSFCNHFTPNILPNFDPLTGEDQYIGCLTSGGAGNFYLEGESSYSGSVCVYPVNSSGNDTSFLFDPDNGLVLWRECTTASASGAYIHFDIDPSNQSQVFNAVAVVPQEYSFSFEQWVLGFDPNEPPFSYGDL